MRLLTCACLGALLAGASAFAEPVPQPKVDYVAKGSLSGRGAFTVRHHGGKLRMDMTIPGTGSALTSIIDLSTRKAVMSMPVPGAKMAMEIDFGGDTNLGYVAGDGKVTGTATVVGERCSLWEVAVPKSDGPVVSCISDDGIGLRTEVIIDGKRQTVMEMTELTRAPQEAALFALPPETKIVKAPADLTNLLQGGPRR